MLRYFGDFIQGGSQWIPHIPVTPIDSRTYVSEFRAEDKVVWLLVNRDKVHDEDVHLTLQGLDGSINEKWIDAYHGKFLENVKMNSKTGLNEVLLNIEAGGYGAILLTLGELTEVDDEFLNNMLQMTSTPLGNYSKEWKFLPQEMENLEQHPSKINVQMNQSSKETVEVPEGTFTFSVRGNAIEGDDLPLAVDVQMPWENSPRRIHKKVIDIPNLNVDKYPVTNAEYQEFLEASGWQPKSPQNWLRHWTPEGKYPDGFEKKPVVWVSHGDALAYCHYYNKRLPHTWEWQWLAQGNDGRPWPWGSEDPDDSRVPVFTDGRTMPPPDDVDIHPEVHSLELQFHEILFQAYCF